MLRFTLPDRKHAHVVFIHGANASPKSFNYIVENSNITNCTKVRYFSNDGFYNNLEKIKNQLIHIDEDEEVFIIAHSLGGIYALHLSQYFNIIGVVSIATPFGGSLAADWAKFFISRRLYNEIGIASSPITRGHKIPIKCPWTQVVTTEGAIPVHIVKNDGVCTISSMKFRKDMQHIEIPYNHYEIMNSPEVVNTVNKKLKSNFIYFGGNQ
jgi:hypothetical protein